MLRLSQSPRGWNACFKGTTYVDRFFFFFFFCGYTFSYVDRLLFDRNLFDLSDFLMIGINHLIVLRIQTKIIVSLPR